MAPWSKCSMPLFLFLIPFLFLFLSKLLSCISNGMIAPFSTWSRVHKRFIYIYVYIYNIWMMALFNYERVVYFIKSQKDTKKRTQNQTFIFLFICSAIHFCPHLQMYIGSLIYQHLFLLKNKYRISTYTLGLWKINKNKSTWTEPTSSLTLLTISITKKEERRAKMKERSKNVCGELSTLWEMT